MQRFLSTQAEPKLTETQSRKQKVKETHDRSMAKKVNIE